MWSCILPLCNPPLGSYWFSTVFSLSPLLVFLGKLWVYAQGYIPDQILVFYLHYKSFLVGGAGVTTR